MSRKAPRTREDDVALLRLYADGFRQQAIAARLGVCQTSVSRYLHLLGLSQSKLLHRLAAGETPEQVVAGAPRYAPRQPSLPFPESPPGEAPDELARVTRLLPAWFSGRMYTDSWYFGLLLVSGQVLLVTSIAGVSDCGTWMEVELAESTEVVQGEIGGLPRSSLLCAPTPRPTCSVRVGHVTAAFEVAST